MLWRQLVKRHLDAPQRVLDDRVRVGRVAPEFQSRRVQQPPRDESPIFMRTTSHQRVGARAEGADRRPQIFVARLGDERQRAVLLEDYGVPALMEQRRRPRGRGCRLGVERAAADRAVGDLHVAAERFRDVDEEAGQVVDENEGVADEEDAEGLLARHFARRGEETFGPSIY